MVKARGTRASMAERACRQIRDEESDSFHLIFL